MKANLTAGSITRLVCPPGAQQAFLTDTAVPGLKVRVTTAGSKAFVFERKTAGRTTAKAAPKHTRSAAETEKIRAALADRYITEETRRATATPFVAEAAP